MIRFFFWLLPIVFSMREHVCKLPSCDLIRKTRLASVRCHTGPARWDFLVTSTPRSGTTFVSRELLNHGMNISHDWAKHPYSNGAVSWILAFEDDDNFGPMRTNGGKFRRAVHQVQFWIAFYLI